MNALSAAPRLFQRNTTHGRFGLFLYIGFAVGVAAPPGKGEALFHRLLEFSIIRWLVRIGLAKRQRAIEQRLLNFNQQRAHRSRDPVLVDERLPFFPRTVASRSSSFTRMSASTSSARMRRAHSITLAFSSSVL